ncbi:MAG: Heme oxygenase [Conexibacter sp.]|nr:Heme oxygenase [Conexibacter sp.]
MSPAAITRSHTRAPGAMATLKSVTAADHDRLERRFDLDRRLRSRPAYAGLLERMLGFYRPMEALLAPFAVRLDGMDYANRRKVPLLEADLRALGVPDRGARLPEAEVLPAVRSPEEAIGILYVLEGATLGGALIARQARVRLGITALAGGSFFGAYGTAAGSRWRSFGAAVELLTAGIPTPATCAAAMACYSGMEAWLCDDQR